MLPELLARDVVLEPHLVGPPSDAAAPERERLAAFARRDSADVAPGYGLDFPAGAAAPTPECVELAMRLLAPALANGQFAGLAARAGTVLWRGERARLEALAPVKDMDQQQSVCSCLAEGETRIIYSCSGRGANVGQLANSAALRLAREGYGTGSCLAIIGGGIEMLVSMGKSADDWTVLKVVRSRAPRRLSTTKDSRLTGKYS